MKKKRDRQPRFPDQQPVLDDITHDIQIAPFGSSPLIKTETEQERIARLSR